MKKSKVKQKYLICEFCGKSNKVDDCLKVITSIREVFYCTKCLKKAYKKMEKQNNKPQEVWDFMLKIRTFLGERGEIEWEN